jgi:hypothetical protein
MGCAVRKAVVADPKLAVLCSGVGSLEVEEV